MSKPSADGTRPVIRRICYEQIVLSLAWDLTGPPQFTQGRVGAAIPGVQDQLVFSENLIDSSREPRDFSVIERLAQAIQERVEQDVEKGITVHVVGILQHLNEVVGRKHAAIGRAGGAKGFDE